MYFPFTHDFRMQSNRKEFDDTLKVLANKIKNNVTITDKSESNVSNVYKFYLNIREINDRISNCTLSILNDNIDDVLLNFIKKFQYPNIKPREGQALRNEFIRVGIKFAPLRTIIKILYVQNLLSKNELYLSYEEVNKLIFANEHVILNNNFDILEVIKDIENFRNNNVLPEYVKVNDYKFEDRVFSNFIGILEYSNLIESFEGNKIKLNIKLTRESSFKILNEIINDTYILDCSSSTQEQYFEYMDMDCIECSENTDIINISDEFQTGGKNIVYYGAPGTGKSKYVNNKFFNEYSKRVTFHPEYSYNDFVGYIRPISDGKDISYDFVPGVFTEILVQALNDKKHMHNLIIEEINRANTAAVFGDLFQLLDRDDGGVSEYIVNNKDIYDYIKRELEEKYEFENGVIFIPANLNIIATMNTADQNVFTMDTAFKRRWEFEYIPVEFKNDHKFKDKNINNLNISWETFVTKINDFMMSSDQEDLMISEDKQIGPYFIKEIELDDPKKFAYKVLLYLWDDVFKMDRHRLFSDDIRTFSSLVSIFQGDSAMSIFNENFSNFILA